MAAAEQEWPWEVDWDTVSRIGSRVAETVMELPVADQIAALSESYEVDWERVARITEQALAGSSWESAAALRPFAEKAIERMAEYEESAALSAWLRQRLDYLAVAEQYVQEPHPPSRPPSPPTAPSVPAPPPQSPSARLPRATVPVKTAPARHIVLLSEDTDLWIRRIPPQPSLFAQQKAPALRRIFESEGVPSALIWLAEVESSFNPAARSPAGATGLYQFMPATAQRFGLSTEPQDQRLDPELSAAAAARYLQVLYRRFRDWPLAIAAYNAGEGRVGRTLQRQHGVRFEDIADHLPVETRMYVPRVAAIIRQREGADLPKLPAPQLRAR